MYNANIKPKHVFSILGILAFLGSAYFLYTTFKSPARPPLEAIPENTFFFAEIRDLDQTWNRFVGSNAFREDISTIEGIHDILKDATKLDSTLNLFPPVKEAIHKNGFYLALVPDSNGQMHSLYVADLHNALKPAGVKDFLLSLTGSTAVTETRYLRSTVWITESTDPIYFYLKNNVFGCSKNPEVLKQSIYTMVNKQHIQSPEFTKVRSTAGKNVDANIYINATKLDGVLKRLSAEKHYPLLDQLHHFASWTELDLILKENEILLNGYTSLNDSLFELMDLFRGQEPKRTASPRILPYNTNLLISLGFEDFERYYGQYLKHIRKNGYIREYEDNKRRLNASTSRDVIKHTLPWIGNEVTFAITHTGGLSLSDNAYALIRVNDIKRSEANLDLLADPVYSLNHKNYKIRRMKGQGLMELLFGGLFASIEHAYFFRIDEFIIFGNSSRALERYINTYTTGKTLKNNINYHRFADNISDKSNIFFYINTRNTIGLISEVMRPGVSRILETHKKTLQNFEGAVLQFSFIHDMFYTNLFVKYNPSYIQEDFALWKVTLEEEIQGQPYFVRDHNTNTLKIIVFDINNHMYLIDHNGKILWKRAVDGHVLSDVFLVDYFKNGKLQYLFNTADHIYLIDLLGRDVKDYPVKLPREATNGLAVFDYDHTRNYRIMLALKDNRIYNYSIKGLPVKGWQKPMARHEVVAPVQHIRASGKDYIIVSDLEGDVKITDRRGNDRIILNEELENAKNSLFYVNHTNTRKGIMLTTDKAGKLTYIKSNGGLDRTDFGDFSPEHHFLYEDFDRNGHKDFIFLDKNRLQVFNRFKNPIMTHTFKNEIRSSPVIIPLSDNENIIGIVSSITGKIYLFDKQGNLLSTPDMIGKTQIRVGSLLNDGQLNIIAGSGHTLYNYYFQ